MKITPQIIEDALLENALRNRIIELEAQITALNSEWNSADEPPKTNGKWYEIRGRAEYDKSPVSNREWWNFLITHWREQPKGRSS